MKEYTNYIFSTECVLIPLEEILLQWAQCKLANKFSPFYHLSSVPKKKLKFISKEEAKNVRERIKKS